MTYAPSAWVMEWAPPDGIVCQGGGVELPPKEASMEQATRSVWTSRSTCFRYMERMLPGHVLFRKRITRVKLLGFLAAQAPCVVAMEACAGAHYWAREIGKLGHHVRLIAPGLRQAVHQAAKERCRRCRGHL